MRQPVRMRRKSKYTPPPNPKDTHFKVIADCARDGNKIKAIALAMLFDDEKDRAHARRLIDRYYDPDVYEIPEESTG